MMRTLVLHGGLKERFGSSFRVDADTFPLLMHGVNSQHPEFADTIRQGRFKVKANGEYLSAEQVQMRISDKVKTIHITPVIAGSDGEGKAILGAVIIAFAIVASGGTLAAPLAGMAGTAFTFGGAAVTWGSVAMLGLAIGYAGVSMMMAPTPAGSGSGAESAEQRASFMFNGATNVSEQGGPVPVVYGRFRVGSTVVSVDISAEDVPPPEVVTPDPTPESTGG